MLTGALISVMLKLKKKKLSRVASELHWDGVCYVYSHPVKKKGYQTQHSWWFMALILISREADKAPFFNWGCVCLFTSTPDIAFTLVPPKATCLPHFPDSERMRRKV